MSTSDRGIASSALHLSAKVSSAADGSFVAVWVGRDNPTDPGDSSRNVLGQRFDPMGNPLGTEFVVNTYTTGDQQGPHLARNAAGNFVVIWASDQLGSFEIFGQQFNNDGVKAGTEFPVTTPTTGTQNVSSLAMDADGGFVVVWRQTFSVIRGQRFDNTGTKVGAEFQINTNTSGFPFPSNQAISTDGNGNFVVVWHSQQNDGTFDVFARRFDSTGPIDVAEFPVNTVSGGKDLTASVCTHSSSGNFVVVWEGGTGIPAGAGNKDIFARRFNKDGVAIGAKFQVNIGPTDDQDSANAIVSCEMGGEFVVVWQSGAGTSLSAGAISGRRFKNEGMPSEDEFRINPASDVGAVAPFVSVSTNSNGITTFVVAWDSNRSPLGPHGNVVAWARRYTNRCEERKLDCLPAAEAKLQYSEKKPGKEKMKMQWKKISDATTQAGFGNPVERDTSVTLCIYGDDDTLVQEFIVDRAGQLCVGKLCWKAKGTKGYGYKDKEKSTDGISKIGYVSGLANEGKADAKGKNNAQGDLPTGVVARLSGNTAPTIQLRTGDGLCVEATMNQVKKDKAMVYKAQRK